MRKDQHLLRGKRRHLPEPERTGRTENLPASRFFAQKGGEPDYNTPLELHLMAGWEKNK